MKDEFIYNEINVNCIGCSASSGEIIPPVGILKKSKYFVVHQDPLCKIPGFIIIASRNRVRSINEMSKEEFEDISNILFIIIKELTLIQEEH